MKKIWTAAFLVILITACTQPQTSYKAERDKVIEQHDVAMADHGIILGNRMKIDSLLKMLPALKEKDPELDTLAEKEKMMEISNELTDAEERMNTWMLEFEPDVTGKSNEEAVQYFRSEKKKVHAIDSLYRSQIAISNTYLRKFR